jgi:peptidoglycan/xylan/chitin deacetylase (PgdA/CDA1 family)
MYIINYHNVLNNDLDTFDKRLPRISLSEFEEEIRFLATNFEIISVRDVVMNITKQPINRKKIKVALTFDDGCYGVLKYAVPILQKYNCPATLYIVSDFTNHCDDFTYFDSIEIAFRLTKTERIDLSFLNLGAPSLKHEESRIKYMKYTKRSLKIQESLQRKENTKKLLELLYVTDEEMLEYVHKHEKYLHLSWDELNQLKSIGYDIGSHTHTHPTLSKIPYNKAFEELSLSYSLIKNNLNIDDLSLAYPHGNIQHISNEIPAIAKQIGYSFALTTIPNKIDISTNEFLVNRMTFEEFLNEQK